VIEAVRDGRFSIWTVEHVDEALAILTGREVGEPGPDGSYPEGTVYRAVEERLEELSEQRRKLAAQEAPSADGDASGAGDGKERPESQGDGAERP
jgi:hypothetical protein